MEFSNNPNNILLLKQGITYSNLWISLGSIFFAIQFYWIFSISVDYYLLGFIFSSTFLTYNFQRFVKVENGQLIKGPRYLWMRKHFFFFKLSLYFSVFLVFFFFLHLHKSTYSVICFSGIVSLFYVAKIPIKRGGTNLRDIPGLKIFLIGIVWMLTAVYIPALQADLTIDFRTHLWALASYFYIIAITIPFDIRDVELDEANKKTIPQFLGLRRAKQIGIGLIIFYFILLCILIEILFLPFSFVGIMITIGLIMNSKPTNNELYYSLLIDGLLILQPLCLYLDFYLLKF
jgi:hypothetical protein